MNCFRLSALAVAGATLAASSMADTIVAVSGRSTPVRASTVNVASLPPTAGTLFKRVIKHRVKVNYGEPFVSRLLAGTVATGPRIDTSRSSYFPTVGFTNSVPPDPDIAVNSKGIIVTTNGGMGFYDRSGRTLATPDPQQFFASAGAKFGPFDPKVLFDVTSNRFYIVYLEVDFATKVSYFLLAVSDTDNPAGTYKTYRVENENSQGGEHWLDYPGFGINKDAIVISGNMFPYDTSGTGVYSDVHVIPKAGLLSGTATTTRFTQNDDFTIQFGRNYDATSSHIFGVSTNYNPVRIYALTTGATPALRFATVEVPTYRRAGPAAGPSNRSLDSGGDVRTFNSAARNGRIVSSHTVSSTGSVDGPAAARWYEFATNGWPTSGAPTLRQAGTVLPPSGASYLYPAANINAFGDIGLTFSRISPSDGYRVIATGRKPTDPLNRMGTPVVLEVGRNETYVTFENTAETVRWGDYFDLEVDPDGRTFWAVGEATREDGRWLTFVKSFAVSTTAESATVVNATSIAPVSGTFRSGNSASLFSADGSPLQMASAAVAKVGQVAGFSGNFTSPVSPAKASFFTLSFKAVAGPTAGTNFVYVLNTKTNVYDLVATYSATDFAEKTIDLTSKASTYMASNGAIRTLVRTVVPPRLGATSASFDVRYDLLNFRVQAATPLP